MKQILFSCLGTTDPVRGEHDGPMLHILRHYRPESALLILTPEMRELAQKDGRFEKTEAWINAHWDGYRPALRFEEIDVRDAYDIDALDHPLHDALDRLSRENPDAELLINVTSGTPQMQMILSQLAMDMRYRARGVQVINFEHSSSKSPRTNDIEYDVDVELLCNEDELPESPNRCVEPEMYAIRREFLRSQIRALLDARDFEAVEKLKDSLPENVAALVSHLAARSALQHTRAVQLAGRVKDLPFPLYAYKVGTRSEYSEVSEYYLKMKNLVKTGNHTEFLLHLEPLTLTLQLALLDRLLQGTGHSTADFVLSWNNHKYFKPERLQNALPELYQHYEQKLQAINKEVKEVEINTYLCDDLLSYYPALPEQAGALFAHYRMLKDLRNQLAHTLCAVTEQELQRACGTSPAGLLRELEATIIACYPACDPAIFHVYDKSVAYIKANL